ncbi:beta-lactamase family protein [Pseudoalteromonas sp. C2R02]|uniref:serine hydrolase domain-containing protein n=1 Tax=Pseudoalteromonas sp. C2R02 TaxID=2841565 RepID=UPI001C093560|nr:serine hydrolase domain-containing protein [Pseudoalteromonas sp. C2R02]MBU2971225.1 beta-lactamase family protein [Pseudoalteromonas sp. C2R02]
MKTSLYVFINLICVLILSACGGSSDKSVSTNVTGVQDTITSTIDTYLNANSAPNEPGLSIIIKKDDVVVYQSNRGLANKQTNTGINSDTGFRLASVSKPFTALAIMQLYEQGLISMEDKLLDYIPELSSNWQAITVEHLLTHRSGIPDFLNDIWSDKRNSGLTNQGLIQFFAKTPELEFPPGSKGDYSNTGYVLLAEIVARVSGLSFSEYMQQNIFTPIGMHNSYITDETTPLKMGDALNFADKDTYHGFKMYTYGSMAQVSSANDLSKFTLALKNHQIVNQQTLALMIEPHANLVNVGDYGYGFAIRDGFDHSGLWDSFNTLLRFYPEQEIELIYLSNGGEVTDLHMSNIQKLVRDFYKL